MGKVLVRKSNYSVKEIIQNGIYLIRTKLFYRSCRLIRFPISIRGGKYIDYGKRLTTGRYCRIEVNGKFEGKRLILGNDINIGDNVRISCSDKVIIGNNVLMGSKVLIIDNAHGKYSGEEQSNPLVEPNKRKIYTNPIIIEDNVWIGEGAIIQQGCHIGKGSIIAANSVVTKNVSAMSIVGGQPAKVLKKWDEKNSKWRKLAE